MPNFVHTTNFVGLLIVLSCHLTYQSQPIITRIDIVALQAEGSFQKRSSSASTITGIPVLANSCDPKSVFSRNLEKPLFSTNTCSKRFGQRRISLCSFNVPNSCRHKERRVEIGLSTKGRLGFLILLLDGPASNESNSIELLGTRTLYKNYRTSVERDPRTLLRGGKQSLFNLNRVSESPQELTTPKALERKKLLDQIEDEKDQDEDPTVSVPADEVRKGMILDLDGKLFKVLLSRSVKSGRGTPVMKIQLKSLETEMNCERTFARNEKLTQARLRDKRMKCLYIEQNNDRIMFQDTATWDEYPIRMSSIGSTATLVKEGMDVMVVMFKTSLVGVHLPSQIKVKVISTRDPLKGQVRKHATIEGGLTIHVPTYISTGDEIILNSQSKTFYKKA